MLTIVINEVDLNLWAMDFAANEKNLTRNYKKDQSAFSNAIIFFKQTVVDSFIYLIY